MKAMQIQEKIEKYIAENEVRRQHGIKEYGWKPDCECSYCGDTGIDIERVAPCYCTAGQKVETYHQREALWKEKVPHLQQGYTLDTHPNQEAADNVRAWMVNLTSKPTGPNLILLGNVGTGKTGLAVAAMREFHFRGVHTMFDTLSMLLEKMRKVDNAERSSEQRITISTIINTGVLVIDDLGSEKLGDWPADRFMLIVDERHKNQRPTIVTSNLTLDQMKQRFGDRITSRLTANATIIPVVGDDLRRRRIPLPAIDKPF